MSKENDAPCTLPEISVIDLVGGPFSVVESDPGVFTSLIRKLGIRGIEVDEVYDIQPWGLDNLSPKGLILCFNWKNDRHHPRDFLDPAAKDVWFANQLIDDACASLAILNVLFNCLDVELGDELDAFKRETFDMSPKMKGLAISNSRLLREAQNSLARPADMWGSLSTIAEATHDLHVESQKPTKKKSRTARDISFSPAKKKRKKSTQSQSDSETFHFIGYVPAHGKVWELDGLKAGPLEVGELPDPQSTEGWENVVRPALRLKMQKYGALGGKGRSASASIQFNLLALVQDRYEVKSDELELLKRERSALEARLKESLGEAWREKVDGDLLSSSEDIFTTLAQPPIPGRTFVKDFGARFMDRKLAILKMTTEELVETWESCINRAMPVKIAVNEEVQKAIDARTETEKRTHDYTPFIKEFLTSLHIEGLLAKCIMNSQS